MTPTYKSLQLPELIEFSTFGGDWGRYIEAVYEAFKSDFLGDRFILATKPVRVRHEPKYDNKVATFWHLVSEGKIEEDRTPSLRRCEKVMWIRCILENKNSHAVRLWQEERPTKRGIEDRICVALPDFSYLVVIQERDKYWLLITAYPVEQEHQRKKMKRKYEEYVAIIKKTGGAF